MPEPTPEPTREETGRICVPARGSSTGVFHHRYGVPARGACVPSRSAYALITKRQTATCCSRAKPLETGSAAPLRPSRTEVHLCWLRSPPPPRAAEGRLCAARRLSPLSAAVTARAAGGNAAAAPPHERPRSRQRRPPARLTQPGAAVLVGAQTQTSAKSLKSSLGKSSLGKFRMPSSS